MFAHRSPVPEPSTAEAEKVDRPSDKAKRRQEELKRGSIKPESSVTSPKSTPSSGPSTIEKVKSKAQVLFSPKTGKKPDISEELMKEKSLNIAESRRKLNSSIIKSKRTKELLRQLSKDAITLGPDRTYTEAQIDDMICKMIDPKSGLSIGTHKKLLKTYENSFSGSDAVDWFAKAFNIDRDSALQKCQTALMNRNVFTCLHKKYTTIHDKSNVFYRFKLLDKPEEHRILNEAKLSTQEIPDPCKLSEELADLAINLLMIPHSQRNFNDIKFNTQFHKFCLRTCKLQKVQLDKMTNSEKLVFFVNLHNVLMVHIAILFGPPTTQLQLKQSLTRGYRIGQYQYSLQLIRMILSGDLPEEMLLPKEDITLHPTNPMVQFCLLNGSDQSPTMRTYTVLDFDEMVSQQAKQFLSDHVEVRDEFSQLWLPKMLLDHTNEFGKNEHEMIVNLTQLMPKHLRTYISTNLSMLDIRFHDNTYNNVKYLKENLTE